MKKKLPLFFFGYYVLGIVILFGMVLFLYYKGGCRPDIYGSLEKQLADTFLNPTTPIAILFWPFLVIAMYLGTC